MADLVVVATAVLPYTGCATDVANAGEAITAGQAVYMHTDGTLLKAITTSAITAAARGVALNGGAVGQPITYVKSGGYNPGVACVVGVVYGVTDTAGGVGDVADRGAADFITILGVATTTSRIEMSINRSGVAIA